MRKRIAFIFLAFIVLFSASFINKNVVFEKFANTFEVYIGESSSCAKIIQVSGKDMCFLSGICGQSFKTEREEFDLNSFLTTFDAQPIFTESLDGGVSIYAYSSKIKYKTYLKGQKVNLQIFLGDQVTVGTPLIYGSF